MELQRGGGVEAEPWGVFFSWHVRLRHAMKTLARKGGEIKEIGGENGEELPVKLEKYRLTEREACNS